MKSHFFAGGALVIALLLSVAIPAAAAPPVDAQNGDTPGPDFNDHPGIPDHAIEKIEELKPAKGSDRVPNIEKVEIIHTTDGEVIQHTRGKGETHVRMNVNLKNGTYSLEKKTDQELRQHLREKLNDPNTSEKIKKVARDKLQELTETSNPVQNGAEQTNLIDAAIRDPWELVTTAKTGTTDSADPSDTTRAFWVEMRTSDPINISIATTEVLLKYDYDYGNSVSNPREYNEYKPETNTSAGTHWYINGSPEEDEYGPFVYHHDGSFSFGTEGQDNIWFSTEANYENTDFVAIPSWKILLNFVNPENEVADWVDGFLYTVDPDDTDPTHQRHEISINGDSYGNLWYDKYQVLKGEGGWYMKHSLVREWTQHFDTWPTSY